MTAGRTKRPGRRKNRHRGRPPFQAHDEALAIAATRGEVIFLPGGRSDAFDLIICEKYRTVFVRIRRTDLYFTYAIEAPGKFRHDIARAHRLPLTEVTAREFWLRLRNGTWQFFLIRHDGLFEVGADGTLYVRAKLPVVTEDGTGGEDPPGEPPLFFPPPVKGEPGRGSPACQSEPCTGPDYPFSGGPG